jgi:hypothetical protein
LHLQETRKIKILKQFSHDSANVEIAKVSLCPKQFLEKPQFQMHPKLRLPKMLDLERLQLKIVLMPYFENHLVIILAARYMILVKLAK